MSVLSPGLYVMELVGLQKQKKKVKATWIAVGRGVDGESILASWYEPVVDYISLGQVEWKSAQYALAFGKKPIRGQFVLEGDPEKPGTDIGKLALCRVGKTTDGSGVRIKAVHQYDHDEDRDEPLGYHFRKRASRFADKSHFPKAHIDTSQEMIVCPICDCQEVHIKDVAVYRKDTVVIVHGSEDLTVQAKPVDAEGSSVVVSFFCEWGHLWDVRTSFHGGSTHTWKENPGDFTHRDDPSDEDAVLFLYPNELWRG